MVAQGEQGEKISIRKLAALPRPKIGEEVQVGRVRPAPPHLKIWDGNVLFCENAWLCG